MQKRILWALGALLVVGLVVVLVKYSRSEKKQDGYDATLQLKQIGERPLPKEFSQIQERRAEQKDTRFKTIKVSADVAKDEITFWAHQLSEHALFLHLGLEDKELKRRGMELHKKFENFRKNMTPDNMADVLPLAKELRAYKIEVLSRLTAGEWIGWIFPLFARHIILELDYFVDKLNGIAYTDRDEIAFWNVINGEHAGFAAHLLDPSERALFEAADGLAKKFEKMVTSEQEMFAQISLQAAKELDDYNQKAEAGIKANKVASVIHPALISHVVREGQRSIRMLNTLKDTTGAIYPEKHI